MPRPDPADFIRGIVKDEPYLRSRDPSKLLASAMVGTGLESLIAIRRLRERLDEREAAAVEEARAEEVPCSWGEIAAAIGITRQSAWQRFGPSSSGCS